MTKLNVHQRMAQAMQKVTYIQKEQKQGMRYSIVSHDAVTAKVRPALLEAGVHYYPVNMTMTQDGNRTECTMSVRFVNIDTPSDFFEVASGGYGIDPQDKGPGKAISYAVKYALLKAMGLETGDDPDMDQDVQHEPKPKENPKNEEQRKTFKILCEALRAFGDRSHQELTEWMATDDVKAGVASLPKDWAEDFRVACREALEDARQREAS